MAYRYLINATYGTKEWMEEQEIINEYGSIEAFQDYLYSEAETFVPPKVVEAFAEQGIAVTFISLESVQIAWERSGWQNAEYHYKRKVYFIVSCYIESESDFFESPIAPLVIIAIGLAIALIVAAITVPYFISQWLTAMTTREWKVEKYGWVLNPETGEWEWKKITEESGREAEPLPILIIVGAVAAVVIVLGLAAIVVPRLLPKE